MAIGRSYLLLHRKSTGPRSIAFGLILIWVVVFYDIGVPVVKVSSSHGEEAGWNS